MINFVRNGSPVITTSVNENDEVQLCPNCSFPNYGTDRECAACGQPLDNDNDIWIQAKFVEKCPNANCDAFVNPKQKRCTICGQNLSKQDAPEKKGTPDTQYVLICPQCKHNNPANVDTCENCGADLEDIDPCCLSQEKSVLISFENVRTHKKKDIKLQDLNQITLGAEAELAEELSSYDYVSRTHCVIAYHNLSLWIKDNSTNGTYIKEKRLERGREYHLDSGTIIGLGDPHAAELMAAFIKITY